MTILLTGGGCLLMLVAVGFDVPVFFIGFVMLYFGVINAIRDRFPEWSSWWSGSVMPWASDAAKRDAEMSRIRARRLVDEHIAGKNRRR